MRPDRRRLRPRRRRAWARRLAFEAVATHARFPRERVEAHFPNLEAGLPATQREFLERLRLEATEACTAGTEWPMKVKVALRSVLVAPAESDRLARAFSLEVAGLGTRAAPSRKVRHSRPVVGN